MSDRSDDVLEIIEELEELELAARIVGEKTDLYHEALNALYYLYRSLES